jgi:low temperature requirement protein LtrA
LFFDLVFVLAVAQISRVLSQHADAIGLLKYVALFVPIWYAWVGFTFYADRFETEETIYRILIFAAMLAVIGLSLTLGNAFSVGGDVPFIVSYVLVRFVLLVLYSRAAYYVPLARPYCFQFILGLGASCTLLLASLFFEPPVRYAIWAVSIALEFAIPFFNIKATRLIPIDRSHIPERFGLFTIIVLGEAVIATATGASVVGWNLTTVATASLGFAMAACIWWINFDFVEDSAITSASIGPRFVYLYGHFFIVASIVATGVGVEHAIKEAMQPYLSLPTSALLAGALAVYFTAITVIRLVTGVCNMVKVRLATIAISIAMIYAALLMPPIAVVLILLLVMAGGIWVESGYEGEEKIQEEMPHLVPCEHTDEMKVFKARSGDGCEECRKNNYKWVHLRLCLSCGHVGCCDTSVNKHATKHFLKSGHPIMASLEKNETWAWCYVDERFVPVTESVEY